MRKHTILWADDDADDLQMMREILLKNNHNDYELVEVHNGREALNFLQQSAQDRHLPCLIILDINMPVLDGKETLSIIKGDEAYKQIPVVVFTTSSSELDKMYCKRLGTEMITKPPSFQSLEQTIIRLLSFCRTSLS